MSLFRSLVLMVLNRYVVQNVAIFMYKFIFD